MIFKLFRRAPGPDTIAGLYGAIVAQARVPAFYQHYGVPDTATGRLEMIILHAVLVVLRLEAGATRGLGQELFDHFCSDIDGNLREMGVGDLAVPRKMKAIGEAFYGRKRAYAAGLAAPAELPAALVRNLPEGIAAAALADYMGEAARQLAALPDATLQAGTVTFPDPAGFVEVA